MIKPISLSDIDVNFDFTSDCDYWSGFWERNDGMGGGAVDPDSASPTLRLYQQVLWSKPLPNGSFFDLKFDSKKGYLSYNGIKLGSDAISTYLRYEKYRYMFDNCMEAYGEELFCPSEEKRMRRLYTIGGEVLFPKHRNSIKQLRVRNSYICGRWDLTLECIRRYYSGITAEKENPLGKALVVDKAFFDLFVDFRGYCEFFLLEDFVSADYSEVKMIDPVLEFPIKYPFPYNFEKYMCWLGKSENLVAARNKRIQANIQFRLTTMQERDQINGTRV